jgi:raffinose/stachyose/melibiose transport system permease protein
MMGRMKILSANKILKKRTVLKILKYLFLILIAAINIFPFYWVLMSSLKSNSQILVSAPFSLPYEFKIQNYARAFIDAKVINYFRNSIVVSVSSVALNIFVAAMAAYSIARIRNNTLLYTYYTLGIMIPIHTMLIPTFIIIKNIGLLNRLSGLSLVYTIAGLSLSIFVLVGFMRTIPKELEDAAFVDGYGRMGIFLRIILPLSKAGLATVGILAFLRCWNDYLFAYIIVSKPKLKTIALGVMSLRGEYMTDFGLLCAGLIIALLPVFIVYIVFQEQIIKGMVAGAVKG